MDQLGQSICMVSYSIIINGSPTGHFHPYRGFRQGDPLSHFLFILGSEVLSRLTLREEIGKNLEGIRISRWALSLSHLLFANDLILFRSATTQTARTFANCLDTYSSWFGQKINFGKSSIHFSNNTRIRNKRKIREILHFKIRHQNLLTLVYPFSLKLLRTICLKIFLKRFKTDCKVKNQKSFLKLVELH